MFPLAHLGIPLIPIIIAERRDIDFRLLALGALLPDIIDKPLGHLILSENNGRIIAHTLIFAIFAVALAIHYRKLLPLSYGIVFHGILDTTFTDPQGTLWPFTGPFRATDFHLVYWFDSFLEPTVVAWEIVGLLSVVYFLKWDGILTKGGLRSFLVKGSASLRKP